MTENEFIEKWNSLQEPIEIRIDHGTIFFTCIIIGNVLGIKALRHYSLFATSEYFKIADFDKAHGCCDEKTGNELRLLFLEFWYNYVLSEKDYLEF